MPELPEVETIVRELKESNLIGLSIIQSEIFWDRTIAGLDGPTFCERIKNQRIVNIHRRGKFIVFSLTDYSLLVHLRMTGKFLLDKQNGVPTSHERVRLYLSDGRMLRYEDQRKFGKWTLTNVEEPLQNLGIEPLSTTFTFNRFKKLLKEHKRKIKPFLLDQRYIAGIGNIYADEALWAAEIHPLRSTNDLNDDEIKELRHAITDVLKKGIINTGTSLGAARANYYSVSGRRGTHQNQLKVFRRNGLPCPRCKTIIKKISVAQRGTHYCPHCQAT